MRLLSQPWKPKQDDTGKSVEILFIPSFEYVHVPWTACSRIIIFCFHSYLDGLSCNITENLLQSLPERSSDKSSWFLKVNDSASTDSSVNFIDIRKSLDVFVLWSSPPVNDSDSGLLSCNSL